MVEDVDMTKKIEAPAKASTPKRQSKDTKFNQLIIDILIYICVLVIGFFIGFGGLIL